LGIRDFLNSTGSDLKHGFRVLRHNPAFALTAVLSLVLGVGANTAIFQLVDALRLRLLPVKDPQSLVELQIRDLSGNGLRGSFSDQDSPFSYPLWNVIRRQNLALSDAFAWSHDVFGYEDHGVSRHLQGLWVSGNFFDALGISPVTGRLFQSFDDEPGCAPHAVISYSMWQREFAGSPNIAGKQIVVEGYPVQVIGVTPSTFLGLEVGKRFDLVLPLCSEKTLRGADARLENGAAWWLTIMEHTREGWSSQRTSAELETLSPGIFQATVPINYPADSVADYLKLKLQVVPAGLGVSDLRERYGRSLWLLLGIAGSVFIIGCANLANVMLARASAREGEMAMRLALGASRARIVRQLTTEGLLLSAISALLGAVLAQIINRLLVAYLGSASNPIALDITWDGRVVLFVAGLTVLSSLAAGVIPAIRLARTRPEAAMKARTGGIVSRVHLFNFRQLLVVAQIALSFVLLAGALLFSTSLHNLLNLDVGFQESGVLVTEVNLSKLKLKPEGILEFKRQLLDKIRNVRAVDSAAEAAIVPLTGGAVTNRVWKDDQNAAPAVEVGFNWVSSDYFKTLGIPLLSGRDFDERDKAGAPNVAIINGSFARRLGMGSNPVGLRFKKQPVGQQSETVFTVVGIVRDAKYSELREEPTPLVFLPIRQQVQPDTQTRILIRSSMAFSSLIPSLKNAINSSATLNPEFWSLAEYVQDGLLRERLMARLSIGFGFLGVLLVTLGVYGVISYIVAQRTNEIGVRMALGATPLAMLVMIMRQVVLVLFAGLTLGSALVVLAGHTVSALLFGVQATSLPIFLGAASLLFLTTMIACYVPARRAAHVDPAQALRAL